MEKRSTNVSDQTRKPLGHKFGIANPELRGDKDLWTEAGLNARGQVSVFTLGNGLSTSRTFDEYGFPKSISTGGVQDLEYQFNPATGNLNWRKDHTGNLDLTETFGYDELLHARLKTWHVTGLNESMAEYRENGNIYNKTGVTTINNPLSVYQYGQNAGPHAVSGIDNPTADYLAAADKQDVQYTEFNKVSRIDQYARSENGNDYTYAIEYGPEHNRKISSLYKDYKLQKSKYYIGGDYEEEIDAKGHKRQLHYISGPTGLFAIYVKNGAADTMYYVQNDYLGSLYCITDEHGQVVTNEGGVKQIYSFDPWGRRRNYKDWSYDGASTSYLFDRGFTGHEMLPEFGLINMNGRVYDPRLARFLSPDNFVQSDNSQNFNRYSYVLNNPLKYTDPDGEIFGTAFTFLWDLGTTIFTKGGIDPWNTPENRREAWENFDPTAEWSKTNKAWKIDKGLFVTDPNRTTAGRALQLISRFTWELPQTAVGNLFSHFRNVSGSVTNVDYYGGATLVNQNDPKKHGWGLTMGSYINSVNLEADPYKDETFRHEYGHTIQSRILGPFYLKHVGLPSFVGSFLDYNLHINNHNDEWYEVQANRLSLRYFENHDPGALDPSQGGTEWNYDRYFGYPTTYKFNWYTIPSIVIGFFPIPYLL